MAIALLPSFLLALSLGDASAGRGAPTGEAACVAVQNEARFRGFAYDHIVHLYSSCTAMVECVVTTDVNPSAISTPVQPGEHVEVLTFRGSPAREFVSSVDCR